MWLKFTVSKAPILVSGVGFQCSGFSIQVSGKELLGVIAFFLEPETRHLKPVNWHNSSMRESVEIRILLSIRPEMKYFWEVQGRRRFNRRNILGMERHIVMCPYI
ncbi:MAG: hypothetical protein SVY10_00485 [Thermodesulfobacteriota bacterium]|nr:hypothetical protein [Thermodesulfobacteriota bacterium]